MKRKIFSLVLVLCLMLSLCTVTASAEDDYVASVTTSEGETTNYNTLADAVKAATDGSTVTLLKDASGDGIIIKTSDFSTAGLTIDFNGHTYTVTDNLAGSSGTESQCFQLLTGGSVTMKNGTIKANNSGVAMIIQNYCDLTLDNMTVDGASMTRTNATTYALSNNCGNVTIKDTTITAKDGDVAFDVYGGSGNYGDVSVTVTGSSKITGKVEVARGSSNDNKNTLIIEDGTTVTGNVAVTAGTSVTIDDATITGSVTVADNSTATVTVVDSTVSGTVPESVTVLNSTVGGTSRNDETDAVALVNGVTYTSLAEAITAAADGGTVKLLANVELTATQEISSSLTIDLNGKTLSVPDDGLQVTGSLTVKDNSEESAGKITSSGDVIEVNGDTASFTLESGTIESTATSGTNGYGVSAFHGGTVNVNGGTITSLYAAVSGNNTEGDMNVYVNGGTLTASKGPAIYMPSDGTLKITGGTLNGGVMARMGDITISGGTILNENSTDNTDTFAQYYNYSGNVWYPNAVTLYPGSYSGENDNNLSLTITGGTIKSTVSGGDAVVVYVGGSKESEIDVTISGATLTAADDGKAYEVVYAKDVIEGYSGTVENNADTTITGGTFLSGDEPDESVEEYLAPGLKLNGSGKVVSTSSPSTSTDNPVTVPTTTGGTVTASPDSAGAGETVTLTVIPDSGYDLNSLTVTDQNGAEVALTDNGNGTYTFTMPDGEVTVSAAFQACPSAKFTDVNTAQYYHKALDWAVLNGVAAGTGATTFTPNGSCTRAEMVTFLWRAAGSPEPDSTVNPFTDVKSGTYYYKAVMWAAEHKIAVGTTLTTFSPNDKVTRGQAAAILYRAAGSPAVSGENDFTDVPANAYYAGAVQWAVSNGVTYGTDKTTFSPNASATRAQTVTFLYRFFQVIA